MENKHFLKVNDKFPIEHSLELDGEYQITSEITVEKQEKKSDGEGGFDFTHKAKFTSAITLIKNGEVIKGKDPQRYSQQLRKALFSLNIDYQQFMPYLLRNLEDITEEYVRTIT